jgi:hypothetical protein
MEKPIILSGITFEDVKKKLEKNPCKCKDSKIDNVGEKFQSKKNTK